jgi:hypothetical protein
MAIFTLTVYTRSIQGCEANRGAGRFQSFDCQGIFVIRVWVGLALGVIVLAAVSGCSGTDPRGQSQSPLTSSNASAATQQANAGPQGTMDLQAFDEVPTQTLLGADRGHLVLYYVDKESGRAVKYDATADDIRFDGDNHRGQFPCILENTFYRLFPATCWSQSGGYTYKSIDIAYQETFDERILMVEVDTSKLLGAGHNEYLVDTFAPYADFDFGSPFLSLQKLGSDNFIAACGNHFKKTSSGKNEVDLFETSDRPMARVLLGYAHNETNWDLQHTGRILLKRGDRSYDCDGIVTVGPDRLVVLSGKTLVIIDIKNTQMTTLDLPIEPLDAILYRLIQ